MSVVEKKVRSVGFKQIRMRRRVFIIGMLSIAVLNFLVFWLYVNFNSILMAFQSQTKGGLVWTLDNFTRFFKEVKISDFQLGLGRQKFGALVRFGYFLHPAAQSSLRLLSV